MPTVEADTVSHVENSLKAYLKGGSQSGDLTQTITSSVKKALLENVEFTPAEKPASLQVENLRTKYISLNPSGAVPSVLSNGNNHTGQNNSNGVGGSHKICQDEMPEPKVVLCPPQKVRLNWANPRRIGPGIQNMGNTCFMNSVLQCLTYTAPFANYILSGEHKSKCRQVGFCAFCEIGNHITRALNGHENVIRPMVILRNLRYIAKDMSWGKQEDSHEFLRLVLDHIQKTCYKGIPNLDNLSKETTIVNQIFGGFLRSQVLCLKCKHRSSIYEPFMDLSLDIKNVTHIQKALERFVHPDHLEGKNAYKCANCKNTVQAQKRFSIHRAPNVLTLQLKRFQFGGSIFGGSGKMTKHVAFPNKLDLRPYMSVSKGEPVNYHLYAVVCHSGYSCNSGHYFAYVCAPNKAWYIMNDSQVNQCQLGRVMSAEAYMLFYLKATPSHVSPSTKQTKIGPQLPSTSPTATGTESKSPGSKGQFTPIGPKRPISSTAPNETASATTPQSRASKILPASQRERVSFGIKLPHQQQQQQQSGNEPTKPRIVMHIKSGKVVSISPTKAAKADVCSPSKLVPYGDESDSDEDTGVPFKVNCKKNGEAKDKDGERTNKEAKEKNLSDEKQKISPEMKQHVEEGISRGCVPSFSKSKEIHTDRVLNTPPKRHGTLKRSLSADGPLTVNINLHHKVNATPGPWHVTDNSVAQSPSLASDCSNNSVNSTTEWNVVDSKEVSKTAVLPEAQYPGWKVQALSPKGANVEKKRSVSPSKADKCSTKEKSEKSKQQENPSASPLTREKTKDSSGNSLDIKKQSPKKLFTDLPAMHSPKKQEYSTSEKKAHFQHEEAEHVQVEKGQNKHGAKDGIEKDHLPRKGERIVSVEKDKKIRVNGHGTDETEKLLGDNHSDDADHSSIDKHKKHKMWEKERKHEEEEKGKDEAHETDTEEKHKKKKKKKKHKKQKHEDREPLLKSSDSESERDSGKRHSKKKRKHSRDEEDEASEFVWVEKTKESLQKGETHSSSKKSKYEDREEDIKQWNHGDGKSAIMKVWDKESKDDHADRNKKYEHSNGDDWMKKNKYDESDNYEKKRRTSFDNERHTKWDGSRSSSNVVNELKCSSVFGYGDKVQSWDGGRSTIDQEVEKDKMLERKRRLEDYDVYEEELDAGQVKKVKRRDNDQYNRQHGNPFQRYQDYSNDGRNRWYSAPSSGDGHYYNDRHSYKDKYRNSGYDRPRHHSYHSGGDRGDNGYNKPYKKPYRNY